MLHFSEQPLLLRHFQGGSKEIITPYGEYERDVGEILSVANGWEINWYVHIQRPSLSIDLFTMLITVILQYCKLEGERNWTDCNFDRTRSDIKYELLLVHQFNSIIPHNLVTTLVHQRINCPDQDFTINRVKCVPEPGGLVKT